MRCPIDLLRCSSLRRAYTRKTPPRLGPVDERRLGTRTNGYDQTIGVVPPTGSTSRRPLSSPLCLAALLVAAGCHDAERGDRDDEGEDDAERETVSR
jgi:hypothetical protein